MDMNVMMQYMSYLLVAIGLMAFLVSVITQVIKAWPGLDRLPTSAVVIVLSLVLSHRPCKIRRLCTYLLSRRDIAGNQPQRHRHHIRTVLLG